MNGTSLSFVFLDFKNSPKGYKPNKGLYMLDATLKIIPKTELSFKELNTIITKKNYS
jgi:hypothetical protein